ncbi:hypothetical protein HDF16_005777 [Granulicella aggregans]|uniref:Uncharacterized protein n=1 Tax=Granulicella aggregans TaxID=474949 RepID=A0A7W7ZJG0_9BACT|nr:hypothetical protein [Granulicella aggregans]
MVVLMLARRFASSPLAGNNCRKEELKSFACSPPRATITRRNVFYIAAMTCLNIVLVLVTAPVE